MSNKREKFQKNREALSIDREWESLAEEIAKERDALKKAFDDLKNQSNYNEIITINPKKCRTWFYSDRSYFELGDIEDLAEDIKTNGQLQPAIVRKIDEVDYEYEIIAGERRWRACCLFNLPLKAVVIDKDDVECMIIQTSENKKQQLSPYSLAKVYLKIMTDLEISQNEMSKRLNIPKSSFSELMSFNKVPEEIWNAVGDMSLVSAKTAAYLAKTCEKGIIYRNALLNVATKIKEGSGESTLDSLVSKAITNAKTSRKYSKVYKSDKGELMFRVTSEGKILIAKPYLSSLNLEQLAERIREFMIGNS